MSAQVCHMQLPIARILSIHYYHTVPLLFQVLGWIDFCSVIICAFVAFVLYEKGPNAS